MRRGLRLARFTLALALCLSASAAMAQQVQDVALTAVVAPGAEPLPDALFTVTKLGAADAARVEAKGVEGAAVVKLAAGRYRVVARYGHSRAEKEILVGGGAARHEVNLNAGSVVMRLIRHVGGPVLRQNVAWRILTFGRDAQGQRQLIASSGEAQPRFTLPEGFYVAQATMGTRKVRHTIEVDTGANYKYTVILQ